MYYVFDFLIICLQGFISRNTKQCWLIIIFWQFDRTELDRSDYGVSGRIKIFYSKFFIYINIFIHYDNIWKKIDCK